jgi:hypothetical protein
MAAIANGSAQAIRRKRLAERWLGGGVGWLAGVCIGRL